MKLSQLIADLKTISSSDRDSFPVRVYTSIDIFDIKKVRQVRHYFSPNTIQFIARSQAKSVDIGEFISSLEALLELKLDIETEISLDDGTRYALTGVEFDKKNQAYAITLGAKISGLLSWEWYDGDVFYY